MTTESKRQKESRKTLFLVLNLFEVESALFEPLKVLDWSDVQPDKHVEDVSLVHVHRDQGLELGSLHLLQVLGRLANQRVQEVEELVVRLLHDLTVWSGLNKGCFRVTGPDHLNAENADLQNDFGSFNFQFSRGLCRCDYLKMAHEIFFWRFLQFYCVR